MSEHSFMLEDDDFIKAAIDVSKMGGLEDEVAISFATLKTGPELESDANLMARFDAAIAQYGYIRTKVFGIKVSGEENTPRVTGKGSVFIRRA